MSETTCKKCVQDYERDKFGSKDGPFYVILCPEHASAAEWATRLAEACRHLRNEAAGFLEMSDIKRHGQTNSRILRLRIEEAADRLADYEAAKGAQ